MLAYFYSTDRDLTGRRRVTTTQKVCSKKRKTGMVVKDKTRYIILSEMLASPHISDILRTCWPHWSWESSPE